MSIGGYIFEKKNLSYDVATNGLSDARWALEIHKTRCEAFLEAAHRSAGLGYNRWIPKQTNQSGEIISNLSYIKDSSNIDYYICDPFNLNTDIDVSTWAYPAFYSFFRNEATNAEYLILTAHGYDNTGTSALYIKPTFLLYSSSNSYRSNGMCMSHAYADYGFNNYNVSSDDFIGSGTTNIIASITPYLINTSGSIKYSSNSLIASRSNIAGYTFQFGYAIKNNHIISLYRNSTNSYWAWSIIGDIVGQLMPNVSNSIAGLTNPYSLSNEYTINPSTTYISNANSYLSFMNADNYYYEYAGGPINIKKYFSGHDNNVSTTMRTSTTTPEDGIHYSAVLIGAALDTNYSYQISDAGVDGHGNGCVGYLDTEIIRQVSGAVLQSNGITFQGGNFIGMRALADAREGYILGWDPSNESIM